MEALNPRADPTCLKDKSAFVTGGASGIGLATVRAWVAAGAYVTIGDIQSLEEGEKLASQLAAEGSGHANYVLCDVTSWDSQIAAFKSAIAFSPTQTLDIVATFAGTAFAVGNQVDHVLAAGEPSLDVDPKAPDCRNFDVNLVGVYYTSWLALHYFRLKPRSTTGQTATGGVLRGNEDTADVTVSNGTSTTTSPKTDKSLILVASIASYMDSPKASTYPASKFGVRGLFRSTRDRTLDIGVRCNLLAPWFVDTPMIAPVKNAMAARGVDMGKALAFVSMDSCVGAATLCAVDSEMHGRALAVQPEGIFDLKDDFEHGWAGDQLRPIIQRRRAAGFRA